MSIFATAPFCFAVVAQAYSTDAQHKVYVILGNTALVKCEVPSFISDFVSVINWLDNEGNEYFPGNMSKIFRLFSGIHKKCSDACKMVENFCNFSHRYFQSLAKILKLNLETNTSFWAMMH